MMIRWPFISRKSHDREILRKDVQIGVLIAGLQRVSQLQASQAMIVLSGPRRLFRDMYGSDSQPRIVS